MAKKRPFVASLAGFDPSAGAGSLADIKTFEMHKVYGFAVCTALTWQNDHTVRKVHWYPAGDIIAQLELLIPKFRIDWFKIGIIENADCLEEVCRFIKKINPQAGIVWDPVLKASAGFSFLKEPPQAEFLASLINWVTPNKEEFNRLIDSEEKALTLSRQGLSIYHKGGHDATNPGKDWLYHQGKAYPFNPKGRNISPKHGSGCIFSAALCANLALAYPVLKACLASKRYIEKILASNPDLLGWHKR